MNPQLALYIRSNMGSTSEEKIDHISVAERKLELNRQLLAFSFLKPFPFSFIFVCLSQFSLSDLSWIVDAFCLLQMKSFAQYLSQSYRVNMRSKQTRLQNRPIRHCGVADGRNL